MIVPADVKIRYTRVRNVDDERLTARRGFLAQRIITDRCRDIDGRQQFRIFVRELGAIEHELVRRGRISDDDRLVTPLNLN